MPLIENWGYATGRECPSLPTPTLCAARFTTAETLNSLNRSAVASIEQNKQTPRRCPMPGRSAQQQHPGKGLAPVKRRSSKNESHEHCDAKQSSDSVISEGYLIILFKKMAKRRETRGKGGAQFTNHARRHGNGIGLGSGGHMGAARRTDRRPRHRRNRATFFYRIFP
jgi:hypothetical protein